MRLSLQLYTLRDAMAADAEGTLDKVRSMGLEYVELAGAYGRPPAEFAETLREQGLLVSGAHVGIESLETDFATVVDEARLFDCEWVIVPYIGQDRRDWSELAKTFDALGRRLAGEGLKFAYHNHDFEFGEEQGLRKLVAETDPDTVFFQLDLGWAKNAGEDPAALMREFGTRAPLVHLKDMAPSQENIHVTAGDGEIDWTATLAACAEVGVEYGSIEMDRPPTDPIEDTRRCVEFFHGRGVR
ncbi:MAG TPA: sugar phosphate isomerase/epimerase [Fimbriimonadaceae bacterium]|nr:sugar phosphate isomerase/epimerase [Fimbriimonadaceae bacterium]